VRWLAELGIVTTTPGDLDRIERLATHGGETA
jgi:hypothetical protein